jgi:transitional endoplasmic reticulum ATPase
MEDEEEDEDDIEGLMPEILSKHFEHAVRDLAQYGSFAQTLKQSRAGITGSTGGSLATFSFPEAGDAAPAGAAAAGADDEDDDEEDIYSS